MIKRKLTVLFCIAALGTQAAMLKVPVDPAVAKQVETAAQAAQQDGNYPAAIREYRRWLELYPNEPVVQAGLYMAIGLAYEKAGDSTESKAYLQLAKSLDPTLEKRLDQPGVTTRGEKADRFAAIMGAIAQTAAAVDQQRRLYQVQQQQRQMQAQMQQQQQGQQPMQQQPQQQGYAYPPAPVGNPGYAPPPNGGYPPPGYAPDPNAAYQQQAYAQQPQGQPQYAQAPQGQPGYPPPGQGQPQYAPQGQPAYAPAPGQPQYAPAPQGQPGYPPPGQGQPQYAPQGQPGYAPPPQYAASPAPYAPPPNYSYNTGGPTRGEKNKPMKVVHDHSQLGAKQYFDPGCGSLLLVENGNLTLTSSGGEAPRVIPASEIREIRLNTIVGKDVGSFHITTRKGLYLHLAPESGKADEGRSTVEKLRQQLGME